MMRSFFTFTKIGLMMMAALFLAAPTAMLAQNAQEVLAHLYRNTNAETGLSKMAMKNSQNADVKKFAHQAMSDDRNLGGKLMAYAVKYNLRLIATAPASTVAAEKQMKNLTGTDFDKMYLSQMDGYVKNDRQATQGAQSAMNSSDLSALTMQLQRAADSRAQQLTQVAQSENFKLQ